MTSAIGKSCNTFEITVSENMQHCEVKINGEKLNGICRVSFELSGKSRPAMLKLELIGEIIVRGAFHPETILDVRQPLFIDRADLPRHGKGMPARDSDA